MDDVEVPVHHDPSINAAPQAYNELGDQASGDTAIRDTHLFLVKADGHGETDLELVPPQPAEANATDRDDIWLAERLMLLWDNHFSDVPQGYPIIVRFASRARLRFGSIAARSGKTVILINRLFTDPYVPTFVVDGTLAHELAHYVHGFGSGLPRLYRDAHRGGVVDKELEKRGLRDVNERAEQWRKAYWDKFYETRCGDILSRRASRIDDASARWQTYLAHPDRRTAADLQSRFETLAASFGYGVRVGKPFRVEWLAATRRRNATSYWFVKDRVLRLHGLLANRRIPGALVDFELSYWLARLEVGDSWQSIHAALCRAGLADTVAEAQDWRTRCWRGFLLRHHPLNEAQRNKKR